MAEPLPIAAPVEPAQRLPAPDILSAAWRHWPLVLSGVVVALGAALFYAQRVTPVYQSVAKVLVLKKFQETVGGVDTRPPSIEDYVATHQALIQSPLIVDKAVEKHHLEALPSLRSDKESVADVVLAGLSVTRNRAGAGGADNVLVLTFQGTSAGECAAVLKAVIASYNDFLNETYKDVSTETVRLITQARDLLHQDLTQKEEAYRLFWQFAPSVVGSGKDRGALRQERLSTIEAKRSALLLRRAELRGQLGAVEAGLADGSSHDALLAQVAAWTTQAEAATGSQPVTLPTQLYPLLAEEQRLLATHGEKHPEVESLRKRIKVTRNLMAGPAAPWRQSADRVEDSRTEPAASDPVEFYRQYCQQELRHIEIADQLLAELFDKENAGARELAAFEIEDESYRTSLERQQRLYDGVVKQLQQMDLVKDMGGYDARTISPPAAGQKVRPNPAVVFPGAAFLGLLAGFSLALLAEARANRPRRPFAPSPSSPTKPTGSVSVAVGRVS